MSHFYSFMMTERSTVNFPFGDRRVLVSIDSNCSKHMTGFYRLSDPIPCNVIVDGAIEDGHPGMGKVCGTMQLGDISFRDTIFVPGLRETIISLGQLDKEDCTTQTSRGKMKVFGTSGELLFSAFLHNGRYFLDTSYYYGPNIVQPTRVNGVDAFVVADAKVDNSAELWHCRMGHANMPDIRRLQHLALGVQIPSKHKLQFCEPCVLSKLTNKPFQNMGRNQTDLNRFLGLM